MKKKLKKSSKVYAIQTKDATFKVKANSSDEALSQFLIRHNYIATDVQTVYSVLKSKRKKK